jgi:chemotaxis protein methyltransferase WspC
MALLDAGVPPERFEINAIDISYRALARAKRGVYSRNSFRGKDLEFRDRYFQAVKEGFVLNPSIRNLVCFSQANLLGSDFLPGKADCDFIFCRNLLIYFDRPTQQKALERIARMLVPSGVLFVGPAEQPLVMEHGFVSANIPMAFACRKAPQLAPGDGRSHKSRKPPGASASLPASPGRPGSSGKAATVPEPQQPAHDSSFRHPRPGVPLPNEPDHEPLRVHPLGPPPSRTAIPPVSSERTASHAPRAAHRALPALAESAQARAPAPIQTNQADLDRARRLADAGRLAEAAAICETHLRENRDSPHAYYLLGLVRDARGDATAVDCYRKALYLEPEHYETLLQMALLARKNGDVVRARAFKRRAERVKLKT